MGSGPGGGSPHDPRCPFSGDQRTPSVARCSGFLATLVALGPLDASGRTDQASALTCAHLAPRLGRRGWFPVCGHPGGLPPDAAELQAALAAHGRARVARRTPG